MFQTFSDYDIRYYTYETLKVLVLYLVLSFCVYYNQLC